MEKSKKKIYKLIACGCAVGTANSVFGGGGECWRCPCSKRRGFLADGARHRHLVILPVSLLTFIFMPCAGYTIFRADSDGARRHGRRLSGRQALGKLPRKTVGIVFGILQIVAGAWLFFFR
ncbi:MAG: hypothetical protein ACLRSW_05325 [Christensenellaceae bacterium]